MVRGQPGRARVHPDLRVMGEPDRGPLRTAAPVHPGEQRPRRSPALGRTIRNYCAGATPTPATPASSTPSADIEPASAASNNADGVTPNAQQPEARERSWSEH